ncbi:hypothetical protein PENDEC_c005G04179 [Penicillium decumbens]|uniref:Citrate synthase n=1 Tax=Penicillium decumbens TaxID=69771 RepID=A0A1V6PGJ9_PENDC|nr:hypothetical protein PENDEC_c005G04179 [Penicillium decumbens]
MSTGTLFVQDSRTGVKYDIPIRRNAIRALDLLRIQAPAGGHDRTDQVSLGLRVYDPGLQNTAVIESSISFSDHERGVLIFRGYTLEQLWDSDFEDMFYLLLWGTYPTVHQRIQLSRTLVERMQQVPGEVFKAIRGLPPTSPPLSLILAGLTACLAFQPDAIPRSSNPTIYQEDLRHADREILQAVASYVAILLSPFFHIERRPRYGPSGLFGAPAAYGPLHFGATESARHALREIGDPNNIPRFLDEVKSGKRKLFGYGHRSYKGIDPRVQPIQAILKDLMDPDPLLKLAETIEVAASTDGYFLSRQLYPNADFYGNFVFTGIGIEAEMIPAAMISHRIMGIMAHWRAYMATRGKIFRPSHIYTGPMSATREVAAKF